MRLTSILREATTVWMGPIRPVLGRGEPYTLNYGSGSPDRSPFLYVPVALGHVRSLTGSLENATAWYDPLRKSGGIGGEQVNYPDYFEVVPRVGRRMKHVGEAHVTVAVEPIAESKLRELFARGAPGVRVRHSGKLVVLRAGSYRDQADPDGPLLVAEQVSVPGMRGLREWLGLSPLPEAPGITHYVPHITLGYVAKLNRIGRSYVDRFGRR